MALHTVRGYCALCTAHCATITTVENGRVVRLDPDPDHPNGGVMCIKGRAAPELLYHPDRLNYPLRRTRPKGDSDPGWERISWNEALDDITPPLGWSGSGSRRTTRPFSTVVIVAQCAVHSAQ